MNFAPIMYGLPPNSQPTIIVDCEDTFRDFMSTFLNHHLTGPMEEYWLQSLTFSICQSIPARLTVDSVIKYFAIEGTSETFRMHWADLIERTVQQVKSMIGFRPVTMIGWAPNLIGSQLAMRYTVTHYVEVPSPVMDMFPSLSISQKYKLFCLIANEHFANQIDLTAIARLAMDFKQDYNVAIEASYLIGTWIDEVLGITDPKTRTACVAMVDTRSPRLGLRIDTDFVY